MLKCPECGGTNYDGVACWGGNGEPMEELCVCEDCSTQFIATYEYTSTRIDETKKVD